MTSKRRNNKTHAQSLRKQLIIMTCRHTDEPHKYNSDSHIPMVVQMHHYLYANKECTKLNFGFRRHSSNYD
jgi:hypothetical protein